MKLEQEHIDLLLAEYTSIGHAICDVHQKKDSAKALEIIGQNGTTTRVLKTLYAYASKIFGIALDKIKQFLTWSVVLLVKTVPTWLSELKATINQMATATGKALEDAVCAFDTNVRLLWSYVASLFGKIQDAPTDLAEIEQAEVETLDCAAVLKKYTNSKAFEAIRTIAGYVGGIVDFLLEIVSEAASMMVGVFTGTLDVFINAKDAALSAYPVAIETTAFLFSSTIEIMQLTKYGKEKMRRVWKRTLWKAEKVL